MNTTWTLKCAKPNGDTIKTMDRLSIEGMFDAIDFIVSDKKIRDDVVVAIYKVDYDNVMPYRGLWRIAEIRKNGIEDFEERVRAITGEPS